LSGQTNLAIRHMLGHHRGNQGLRIVSQTTDEGTGHVSVLIGGNMHGKQTIVGTGCVNISALLQILHDYVAALLAGGQERIHAVESRAGTVGRLFNHHLNIVLAGWQLVLAPAKVGTAEGHLGIVDHDLRVAADIRRGEEQTTVVKDEERVAGGIGIGDPNHGVVAAVEDDGAVG